jgi:hypothetical protein
MVLKNARKFTAENFAKSGEYKNPQKTYLLKKNPCFLH